MADFWGLFSSEENGDKKKKKNGNGNGNGQKKKKKVTPKQKGKKIGDALKRRKKRYESL